MGLYRKRPIVVEARQVGGFDDTLDIKRWCGGAFPADPDSDWDYLFSIETLEGWMNVDCGDWVIKGVNGEFYPCKPDIFAATYDAVDPGVPAPPTRRNPGVSDEWRLVRRRRFDKNVRRCP